MNSCHPSAEYTQKPWTSDYVYTNEVKQSHNTQIYALAVLIFNDEQYFYIDGNMDFVTLVEALTRLARPVALVATSADTSSSVTSETGLILQSLS